MSLSSMFEPIRAVNRRYDKPKITLSPWGNFVLKFLAWYVVVVTLLVSYKFYLLVQILLSGEKLQ